MGSLREILVEELARLLAQASAGQVMLLAFVARVGRYHRQAVIAGDTEPPPRRWWYLDR